MEEVRAEVLDMCWGVSAPFHVLASCSWRPDRIVMCAVCASLISALLAARWSSHSPHAACRRGL